MQEISSQFIVTPLLALLVFTAITVARMRDLWAAVMLTGVYSFLGAGWMFVLDAPDVAFTEAAVGAGISTVLMLSTLALTSRTAKAPKQFPWLPLAVVSVTGAALLYGTVDMFHYGDANAPIHNYPKPGYIDLALARQHETHDAQGATASDGQHQEDAQDHRSGHEDHAEEGAHDGKHESVPNVVTVVLASYRGFDTLGETTVIFTAGIAVMILLRGKRDQGQRS